MVLAESALFDPVTVGGLKLRNRVVLPAHTTNFGQGNLPTTRNAEYLAARARGGVGLIVTEAIRVHPSSAGRHESLGSFSDDSIDAFRQLASAVQAEGARIFAQIMHIGRQAAGDATRTAAWGASAIPWARGAVVPHVMGQRDIDTLVAAFGSAARRMQESGFDGLEIHAGHGHLLEQFLSPATNARSDAYGGSYDARLRLLREVLDAVSSACDLPIGLRVSMQEFLPNGLGPETVMNIVGDVLRDHSLAYVHASHSAYQAGYPLSTQMADMHFPQTPFIEHSRMLKERFPGVPVIAVCRIDTMERAAELIESGEADLVALARPQIADPECVKKALEGRSEQTRMCLACNQACIGRVELNLPISCVVNPEVGEEATWRDIYAQPPLSEHVLVIGGGPAGLSAAVGAARRGARVTVVEADTALGGQVNIAAPIGGRAKLAHSVSDLIAEVQWLECDVRLGQRADVELIRRLNPDRLIVATGAVPAKRSWDGHATVLDTLEAARNLERLRVADKVLLVDGEGTWESASLVEELAGHGVRVELVSPLLQLLPRINTYVKANLLERLKDLPVGIHIGFDVAGLTALGVQLIHQVTGETLDIDGVDYVIDVAPWRSVDELYRSLETEMDVTVVGDANSRRTLLEAIYEGRIAGATGTARTVTQSQKSITDPLNPNNSQKKESP